eukprot:766753-Hanusia_phi.AAC.4
MTPWMSSVCGKIFAALPAGPFKGCSMLGDSWAFCSVGADVARTRDVLCYAVRHSCKISSGCDGERAMGDRADADVVLTPYS